VSIAFWVRASADTGNRTLVAVNTAAKGNVMLLSLRDDDVFEVYDAGSPAGWEGDNTFVVADGNWHHLAYTSNGTTGRLYVDGVEKATHIPDYTFSSDDLWSLGQEWDSGGPGDFLDGILDDVRVYNQVLSADAIQTLADGDDEISMDLTIGGDFTRNGGVFAAGGGTVTFDGSGTQTLDTDAIVFHDLAVTSGSTLVDLAEFTVGGSLTNNGTLQKTQDVNGSADVTFFDTGGYGGLTLNANGSDLGSTIVKIKGNQDCTGVPGETVRRCFDIAPSTTTGRNATVTFYFAASELSGNECSTLDARHWDGSNWVPETTGSRSCAGEPYWLQATGVSDFSPFVLRIPAPVADFVANLTEGPKPLEVAFTDQSTGVIDTWLWTFGEGEISSDQHPTHLYNASGTYTVSLTVSGAGGSGVLTRIDYITVTNQAPVADAGDDQGVDTETSVQLDGTGSSDPDDDLPLTYLWTQTGGAAVTLSDPAVVTPTFTAPSDPAVLTFTLTVTDSLGLPDLTPDEVVVTVTNQAPVADAGDDQSVDTNTTVTLDGSGSSDPDGDLPLSYLWTQTGGPGVTLSDPAVVTPTFTAPSSPAVLTFTLAVTDKLGLAGLTPGEVVITVTDQPPVAGFVADLTEGPAPLEVAFTDQSTGAINTWLWTFGDGLTSSDRHPTHLYATPGTFTVSLMVSGLSGSDVATRADYITVTKHVVYLPLVIRGEGGN
jgi:PKD repeat protein